jgi:UDP-glucose-4-epimerase GalE
MPVTIPPASVAAAPSFEENGLAHLLVSGGAGYVGSHALLALRAAGHSAIVVDDLSAGHVALLGEGGEKQLERCDVGDPVAMRRVFAERGPFDGVLHFAAFLSVPESVAQPARYYRNNVGGSACLLEAALDHGVRAFVLSSTCAVYGTPARVPIDEATPLAPINPYGASKRVVEEMLAAAEASHGLHWSALRYFNACGADPEGRSGECHDPEIHLIPAALETAAGLRDALQLHGDDYPTPDGTCIRDYIHVADLADAHVRAIDALLRGESLGVHNLGTGKGHSVREVIDAVERVTGRSLAVKLARRREGDPPKLVADASRVRAALGWEPRHSDLDTIVATAWAWLRKWKGL